MNGSEKKIFQPIKKYSLQKYWDLRGFSFGQRLILLLLHIISYFAKDDFFIKFFVWPESNKEWLELIENNNNLIWHFLYPHQLYNFYSFSPWTDHIFGEKIWSTYTFAFELVWYGMPMQAYSCPSLEKLRKIAVMYINSNPAVKAYSFFHFISLVFIRWRKTGSLE